MEQVAKQFIELMHQYEATDYNTLVALARNSMSVIMNSPTAISLFKQMGRDPKEIANVIIALFAATVNADGAYSAKEQKFIEDVVGTKADFLGDFPIESSADLADAVVDALTQEEKSDAINLAATIAACDGNVDLAESKFIIRLLA